MIVMANEVAPATPSAGNSNIYVDSTSKALSIKDDAGNVSTSFATSWDGWQAGGETWTYASADAPTFTFTIPTDLTAKYYPGMRIKLTQTTVKYFIITAVAYGAPNTTVTVYGGTDYTLANAAITLPYFSMMRVPMGFPVTPAKWVVTLTDGTLRTQATPAAGTWYNLSSLAISIPIGVWNVHWNVKLYSDCTTTNTTVDCYGTLSTANNSESDTQFTVSGYALHPATNATKALATSHSTSKILTLAAKTSYYCNAKTGTANVNQIGFSNATVPLYVTAVCAYL
jgi:hypothetical protein